MAKKTILGIIIVITFGLFGIKALFHEGFYTSHDGEHQVIRLYHFDKALKDGQFPPRWAGTADNGYGYPLFIFSYQSPWFIGVPLLHLGFNLTDSIKGVFIVGFILSGLVMYLWLKDMLGVFPALLGGIMYIWAPYRFCNLYVRASLGEATVFMFIPLLFWGIWKCKDDKKWLLGIILTAIGLTGLILSHLMGLIIFAIPLMLWVLLQINNKKENRGQVIKRILFALILGTLLSSYYLIPAILEKNLTVAPQILQSHFQDHFVTLTQLVYSKWDYGFDFPGTVNDRMSFQIGISHWIIMIFVGAIVLYKIIRKKIVNKELFFVLLTFGYSIFMMLDISKPLWNFISKYAYFDFPWRFLSLSVFIASMSMAFLIKEVKRANLLLALFIIAVTIYGNRNHLNVNQYINIPDKFYIENTATSNSYDEYRPKTLDASYVKEKRNKFEGENIIIKKETSRSNYYLVEGINNNHGEKVKTNIAYYPGWKVFVNGLEQKNILGSNGIIETNIPHGNFIVEARFTDTPFRTIANILSLFSLVIIIYLGLRILRK